MPECPTLFLQCWMPTDSSCNEIEIILGDTATVTKYFCNRNVICIPAWYPYCTMCNVQQCLLWNYPHEKAFLAPQSNTDTPLFTLYNANKIPAYYISTFIYHLWFRYHFQQSFKSELNIMMVITSKRSIELVMRPWWLVSQVPMKMNPTISHV